MDTTSSALINSMRGAIKRLPDGYVLDIELDPCHTDPYLCLSLHNDCIESVRVERWEDMPNLIAELVDLATKHDA